jgi:hypothetical protein
MAASAEPEVPAGGAIVVVPAGEPDSGIAKRGSGTPIAGATCARLLEQPRQIIDAVIRSARRM